MNSARDYDKEPIVIRDYGGLFYWILPVLIMWLILFYSEIHKITSGDFSRVFSNNLLTIMKVGIAMPISLILIVLFYYFDIKQVYSGKSYFKFSNKNISYYGYKYDQYLSLPITKSMNIHDVEKISFCTMIELTFRYGRKMKAQPKKSTFSNALAFVYYLIIYVFSVLPYRVLRLIKNKESLKLLNKNIVIVFKNENYLLVNIYSKKDLDDLLLYFKEKNIEIDYKTKFLYQVQRIGQRWIATSKYEDWK